MIQDFSVQNFLSFREKQTISFVATPDKKLKDELTLETKPGGVRLLRLAMIYGANASGKSNLLQAIQALWKMMFLPRNEEHEEVRVYQPFELSKNEPTRFEITFWANGRKYQYELVYDKHSILYEKMLYTSDKDVLSLLFEREGEEMQFGTTIGIKTEQRKDLIRETLKNHTLISTLNKKNLDVPPVIKELYEWVKKNNLQLGAHNNAFEIAGQAESNPKMKRLILDLLNKADFNIIDFNTVYFPIPEKTRNDFSIVAESAVPYMQTQLLFTHKSGEEKFQISYRMESAGTRVYFRLARLLFDLKTENCSLLEDEIDDSLHYDLLIHYLQTFLQANCCSQLFFATHNLLLLSEDWLIRRDMVWLVEKDRNKSSSTLYRASDMGIHKNVSLMNAYKIGKLGAKPVLGSTFLNAEDL